MKNITFYFKNYSKLIIWCAVFLSAHIVCDSVCPAAEDDYRLKITDDRYYVSQGQYGPGWVIPSILNKQNESDILKNIEKHNNIENKASSPVSIATPTGKDTKSNIEAELPLQKKKGSGEQANVASPTTLPTEGSGQVKDPGLRVPNIPDPNFTTPEEADKAFRDAIASPERIVAIGNQDYFLHMWNAEDGIHYNIQDANGKLRSSPDNIVMRGTDIYAPHIWGWNAATLGKWENSKSYLTDVVNIQSPSNNLEMATVLISTYRYSADDNSYKFSKTSGHLMLDFSYGYNKPFGNYIPSYGVNTSEYDFKTGDYNFDTGISSYSTTYMRDSNGNYSGLSRALQVTDSGNFTYTPTVSKLDLTLSDASSITTYRPVLNYNPTHWYDSYLVNRPNNNNTFPLLSDKDDRLDSLKPDNGLDIIKNKQLESSASKPQDETASDKFHSGYIDALGLRSGLPIKDAITLQEIIGALENKESKTDMEENLLIVARALQENDQYLDEKTLKDFEAVVKLIEMAEDMKGLIKEEDFQVISRGLSNLVEEEHSLYNDYLKTTQNIYEKLEVLLGVIMAKDNLPDEYMSLSKANSLARKKISVDLAIERLKSKDKNALTNNEKEVLKIDTELLRPGREEYVGKLKMAIASFAWDVNATLKDKTSVFISSDNFSMKTLVSLDKKEISPSTR